LIAILLSCIPLSERRIYLPRQSVSSYTDAPDLEFYIAAPKQFEQAFEIVHTADNGSKTR
jgi:hypothetical protein